MTGCPPKGRIALDRSRRSVSVSNLQRYDRLGRRQVGAGRGCATGQELPVARDWFGVRLA